VVAIKVVMAMIAIVDATVAVNVLSVLNAQQQAQLKVLQQKALTMAGAVIAVTVIVTRAIRMVLSQSAKLIQQQ
jgi:hypothetical protein